MVHYTIKRLQERVTSDEILVIGKEPDLPLPETMYQVHAVHAIHANGAKRMIWNGDNGTFTCNCGKVIPVSKDDQPFIYQALAEGHPVQMPDPSHRTYVAFIRNSPPRIPIAVPIY